LGEASLTSEFPLSAESFVWGLQNICQLQRAPFVPDLILQQFPPPHDLVTLQRAARALGFESGVREVRTMQLPRFRVPFVAALRPTSERPGAGLTGLTPASEDDAFFSLALVLRCTPKEVVYAEPGNSQVMTSALADFERRFAGKAFLWTPLTQSLRGDDAALVHGKGFGFRWFVPELLRHRSIWRDVLLASLAIQLLALATPILMQIMLDKVIAHHTVSTLTVIAVALAVFIVFTTALSWVRQGHRARDLGQRRGRRGGGAGTGAHGHAAARCRPQGP
jgi:subfamily B ATP-binding cassette protein HlyB/CyaB